MRWEPHAADRLMASAMTLFIAHGYADTTVADIAAAAGLTKRTFFRHFTDKRDVLVHGSETLRLAWVEDVRRSPERLAPLESLQAGHATLCRTFDDLHHVAAERSHLSKITPELSERELLQLDAWVTELADALVSRGVDVLEAHLAALTEMAIFRTAFDAWVAAEAPSSLRPFLDRSARVISDVIGPRSDDG